jgi:hypothetical protein
MHPACTRAATSSARPPERHGHRPAAVVHPRRDPGRRADAPRAADAAGVCMQAWHGRCSDAAARVIGIIARAPSDFGYPQCPRMLYLSSWLPGSGAGAGAPSGRRPSSLTRRRPSRLGRRAPSSTMRSPGTGKRGRPEPLRLDGCERCREDYDAGRSGGPAFAGHLRRATPGPDMRGAPGPRTFTGRLGASLPWPSAAAPARARNCPDFPSSCHSRVASPSGFTSPGALLTLARFRGRCAGEGPGQ